MIRRILARKSLVQATTKYIRGGDGHGGRALPFGRQAPFTGNVTLILNYYNSFVIIILTFL
jgi:hypothetical protein